MKRTMILLLFCSFSSVVCGQQLFLETGKTISSFKYENSLGQAPENLQPSTNSFLGLGFSLQPSESARRVHLLTGISYNKYGASGSDTTYGNYYQWNLNYLAANIGVDYEFLRTQNQLERRRGLSLGIQALISTEFLVQGTQTLNRQVFDLIGEEQFKNPFIFFRGGLGATYCVSKELSVFAQYSGGMSTRSLAGKSNDLEKLRIIAHQIGVGLLISLGTCNYCYPGF